MAVAVFGLVVAAAAGAFSSIQQAWRKQRNTLDLVQNSRWAMERMANEIREKSNTTVSTTPPIALSLSPGPSYVWYWRGDGVPGTYGNTSTIYRGVGGSIAIANGNRQELTNFIVDNPDLVNNTSGLIPIDGLSDPVFIRDTSSALLTITLTVRPQPAQAVGRENRDYTLRTQVRWRN